MKMYAVAFALDGMGDIYLDARLPLAARQHRGDRPAARRGPGVRRRLVQHDPRARLRLLDPQGVGVAGLARRADPQPRRVPRSAGARRLGTAEVGRVRVAARRPPAGVRRLASDAACVGRRSHADQRERASGVRHRGRGLAEEDHAQHDRDRRDEVGGHAEAARAHVLEREGVGRERDRRREHPEVDQPPDATTRARRAPGRPGPRERQAADRADRAGQPGDVDGREPADQRLLEDQADRVGDRADQAEHHADELSLSTPSEVDRRSGRPRRTPAPARCRA